MMVHADAMTAGTARWVRTWGAALIIIIGLLNFHVPHFLFQAPGAGGRAGYVLEAGLLLIVVAAALAAVGIARERRWGWMLGVIVAAVAVVLWLLQETIGLPGLPRAWTEPSRLVALLVEGIFVLVAGYQLRHWRADLRSVRSAS